MVLVRNKKLRGKPSLFLSKQQHTLNPPPPPPKKKGPMQGEQPIRLWLIFEISSLFSSNLKKRFLAQSGNQEEMAFYIQWCSVGINKK